MKPNGMGGPSVFDWRVPQAQDARFLGLSGQSIIPPVSFGYEFAPSTCCLKPPLLMKSHEVSILSLPRPGRLGQATRDWHMQSEGNGCHRSSLPGWPVRYCRAGAASPRCRFPGISQQRFLLPRYRVVTSRIRSQLRLHGLRHMEPHEGSILSLPRPGRLGQATRRQRWWLRVES